MSRSGSPSSGATSARPTAIWNSRTGRSKITSARAIYRELGHTERIADQCTNIAYTRFMQQDHADALRWYRKALGLYTAAGSEPKRRFTAENVERLEAVLGES